MEHITAIVSDACAAITSFARYTRVLVPAYQLPAVLARADAIAARDGRVSARAGARYVLPTGRVLVIAAK